MLEKFAIVLCGDHGGELDRTVFEIEESQLCNALINAIRDWTVNPGDTIRIERED